MQFIESTCHRLATRSVYHRIRDRTHWDERICSRWEKVYPLWRWVFPNRHASFNLRLSQTPGMRRPPTFARTYKTHSYRTSWGWIYRILSSSIPHRQKALSEPRGGKIPTKPRGSPSWRPKPRWHVDRRCFVSSCIGKKAKMNVNVDRFYNI